MPGLTDGWELAYRAIQMRPQIAVLLTSGFIRSEPDEQRVVDAALPHKPWRVRELLQHVVLLLAERRSIPAPHRVSWWRTGWQQPSPARASPVNAGSWRQAAG